MTKNNPKALRFFEKGGVGEKSFLSRKFSPPQKYP
jgi:hypothetical protein